jgi:hypothetical protein
MIGFLNMTCDPENDKTKIFEYRNTPPISNLVLCTYDLTFDIFDNLKININVHNCKFIFIVIYKQSHNVPNLVNIKYSFEQYDPIRWKHTVSISLDNIIMYDFNDFIVYGFSTNPTCDMKYWTQIKTETLDHDLYFTHNNVQYLSLTFNDIVEQNIVKIISVTQNIQINENGFTRMEYW